MPTSDERMMHSEWKGLLFWNPLQTILSSVVVVVFIYLFCFLEQIRVINYGLSLLHIFSAFTFGSKQLVILVCNTVRNKIFPRRRI